MSTVGSPEPSERGTDKPPKRHWQAKEPFFDLKLSHCVQIALTVVLGCVAFAQYKVYNRQASIIQTQTEILNQQNALTEGIQRAFITVDGLTITPTVSKGKTVSWRGEPVVKNKGYTTAVDVKIKSIVTSASREQLEAEMRTAGFIPTDPSQVPNAVHYVNEMSGTLGPQNSKWDGQRILVTIGAADWLTNDQAWADFVWGVIRYKDVFFPKTEEHVTEYCFIVTRPPDISADSILIYDRCDWHNCTDEQCKSEKAVQRDRTFNYNVSGRMPDMERFDEGPYLRDLFLPEFGTQQLMLPPSGGWPPNPLAKPTPD